MAIDPKTKEILDQRLVKGEISHTEYEKLIETLEKTSKAAPPPEPPPQPEPKAAPPPRPAAQPPAAPRPAPQQTARPRQVQYVQQKDFVGPAVLAFILYYVGFYIVGLIVNICYLSSANSLERQTGRRQNGKGCLQFLIFFHVTLPLILLLLFLLASAMGIGLL